MNKPTFALLAAALCAPAWAAVTEQVRVLSDRCRAESLLHEEGELSVCFVWRYDVGNVHVPKLCD